MFSLPKSLISNGLGDKNPGSMEYIKEADGWSYLYTWTIQYRFDIGVAT
jgi:hypothetical protein